MILVTGGAGYIGAHTNKALNQAGYETVVVDNLSKGYENFVKWLYRFSEISRDAQIVLMKYGVNCNKAYTSREIGEIFDLTEARVNYIIKTKLQQYYKLLSTKDDIKSLVK